MDKFIRINTVYWIHLVFSKTCAFFYRAYLYSDCADSRSEHPFEINLLGEFWQEVYLCIKLKFVDAFLLSFELAAKCRAEGYNFR